MILMLVGSWRAIALRGAALIAFGILALVWPDLTLTALILLFGIYVLIDGIALLADVFTTEPRSVGQKLVLALQGLIGVGAAIITFVWPDITALALLYVIAFWAALNGVLQISAAIRLRREIRNEWVLAVIGAVSIAFAVMLVITPGAGALAITWLIGWWAILAGVLTLALAWKVRRLEVPAERPRGAHGVVA